MGNYQELKDAISAVIKTNGNEEITGNVLKNTLLTIVNTIGSNMTFVDVAKPTTNPGTPDQKVFYLASKDGVYSNFNNIEVNQEVVILTNRFGVWQKISTGIANSDSVKDLLKATTTINVSALYPTNGDNGSNRYTLETAIQQIPNNYNYSGLKLIFINKDTFLPEWWMFKGGTLTDTNRWLKVFPLENSGNYIILNWLTDKNNTRKQISLNDRKKLLLISYADNNNNIVIEQYKSTSYTDAEWEKDANWDRLVFSYELDSIYTELQNIKKNIGIYTLEPLNISYISKTGEKIGTATAIRQVFKLSKTQISDNVKILNLSAKVGGSAIAIVSYWNDDTFVNYDTTISAGGSGGIIDVEINLPQSITYTDIYFSLDPSSEYLVSKGDNIERIEKDLDDLIDYTKPQIVNIPLPKKTIDDECNILYIGSSWMQDNWALVAATAKASNIKANVYDWYKGSANFEDLLDNWETSTVQLVGILNDGSKDYKENCSIKDAVTYKKWDIIVIANGANASESWDNFTNAPKFVRLVKMYSPQSTFATYYGWVYEYQVADQLKWEQRLSVYIKWVKTSGIDITIPTGMALWSLLTTQYGIDPSVMYRGDSTHLSYGFGRYIAACTNFVSLLTPIYQISVLGNSYRCADVTGSGGNAGDYTITDEQANAAQLFALSANAAQYSYINMNDEV